MIIKLLDLLGTMITELLDLLCERTIGLLNDIHTRLWSCLIDYEVATISRLPKNTGLFCKRAL